MVAVKVIKEWADEAFQDWLTRTAWGDVWSRPGLDRRTRSIVTLTALTALRAENEIAMHVRGAIANGLTPQEIGEVLRVGDGDVIATVSDLPFDLPPAA